MRRSAQRRAMPSLHAMRRRCTPSAAGPSSILTRRHGGAAAASGLAFWIRSSVSSRERESNPCCATRRKASRCANWPVCAGARPERIAMPSGVRMIDAAGERFAVLESHWRALCERALECAADISRAAAGRTGPRSRAPSPHDHAEPHRCALARRDRRARARSSALRAQRALAASAGASHRPRRRANEISRRSCSLPSPPAVSILPGFAIWPSRVRAPEDEVRGVLRKCVAQGEVYQIVRDLFYHRDCVRELRRVLKEFVDQHGVVRRGPVSRCHRRWAQAHDSDFGVLRPCWLYSPHARCAGAACRQQLAR